MRGILKHQACRIGLAVDACFDALERNMEEAKFVVDAALLVIMFGGIGTIVCLMYQPLPVMP